MAAINILFLTDGVVCLRPLEAADGAAHLAGEDEQIAAYFSGGRSTEETVVAYIERCQDSWRNGGPLRAFAIVHCASGAMVGSIEANLSLRGLESGQVNISYGVFADWRGQGIAGRAVSLVCEYLRKATTSRQVILRTAPENVASARVAEKLGFRFEGLHQSEESMLVYSLDLCFPQAPPSE